LYITSLGNLCIPEKERNKLMNTYPRLALFLFAVFCVLMCKAADTGQAPAEEEIETEGSVFVLCYHSFLDIADDYTFPLRQLDAQMETLKNAGFNFITAEEFIAKRYTGPNNVLITIDDGNMSAHEAYYTVFIKYGIKPVLAIYPAITGRVRYALTWEELAELREEGCAVAAHGFYHLFLDERHYRKEPALSRNEVVKPKEILELRLGIDINMFMYPYGLYCDEIVQLVEDTGYEFAFTIKQGVVHSTNTNMNPLELPRYLMANSSVHHIFRMMFEAIGETYVYNPELHAPRRR